LAAVSRTRLHDLVRAWRWAEVDAGLDENPGLLAYVDERGRNWLHVCCGVKLDETRSAGDSIKTAEVLLRRGQDVNQEAFTEGDWKATPLWYAIGWGRNLALADVLLKQGCNPNYCLFAAAYNHDVTAINLLLDAGADIEDPSAGADGSPFIGAIRWSRFAAAEAMLKRGANVNRRDDHGMTALHYLLKKSSDKEHIEMLIAHGARGDIPDPSGTTAIDILGRKCDPDYRRMAETLAAVGQAA